MLLSYSASIRLLPDNRHLVLTSCCGFTLGKKSRAATTIWASTRGRGQAHTCVLRSNTSLMKLATFLLCNWSIWVHGSFGCKNLRPGFPHTHLPLFHFFVFFSKLQNSHNSISWPEPWGETNRTTTRPCKWVWSDYLITYGSILCLNIGRWKGNTGTGGWPNPRNRLRPHLSHQIFISPLGPHINVSINASNSICPSAGVKRCLFKLAEVSIQTAPPGFLQAAGCWDGARAISQRGGGGGGGGGEGGREKG